jgi:hypothetical protein
MKRQVVTLVIGLVILVALACNAPAPTPAPPTEPLMEPSPTEQPPTPTPVETPTATLVPPPDLTTEWKVYINEEAGFSFQYPRRWVLEEWYSSGPPEEWRISKPHFAVYTNFIGGFEAYELEETRVVTLGSGQNVEMAIHKQAPLFTGGEVENSNIRLVLVSIPDIGPSGLVVYSFDKSVRPGGLAVLERILSTFEVLAAGGEATEDASAWQTYSNPEHRLSLEYPADWEIREVFVPEKAGGVEDDVFTIILGRVGGDNANDWIRVNPRQFQREVGTCREVDEHSICTYSEDRSVIDVLDRLCSTFETW